MTRTLRHAWLAALVFAGFLVLYGVTGQRGVCWQDSGVRQWRVLAGSYTSVEGIALSHPLYVAMARGFLHACPWASPTHALNVFSGVGLALALAGLAWLVARLTSSLAAGACAAALLGLAHMPWWLASVTEVYTWSVAGLLLELLLLQELWKRPRTVIWVALAFVNGAGWSVHNLALLATPVYAVAGCVLVRRAQLKPAALAWGAVAFVAGGGPVLLQVFREAGASGIGAAVQSALCGHAYRGQVMGFRPASWRLALDNAALFLLNFASPCWLLVPVGLRDWKDSRPFLACLAALTGIHALFFVRYFIADQALFALPLLALLAILAGRGLARAAALHASRKWLLALACALAVLVPPVVYAGVCRAVTAWHGMPARARHLPFRDEARYWLLPWKMRERSADDFASAALAQVEAGAVIYADTTVAAPLYLVQAQAPAAGKPVRILSDYLQPDAGREFCKAVSVGRPCYVVSPVPGYVPPCLLDGHQRFMATGVLYRVTSTTR